MVKSLAESFRHWYAYEKDCNAKVMTMLRSVTEEQQELNLFPRTLELMAHTLVARNIWANRLGFSSTRPKRMFMSNITLTDLGKMIEKSEAQWTTYFEQLDDQELMREVEYQSTEGEHYRWNVEGALTQLQGHAIYHRGQITFLIDMLEAKVVDTDFVLWAKPTPLDAPQNP